MMMRLMTIVILLTGCVVSTRADDISCQEALVRANTIYPKPGLTQAILMEDATGKLPSGVFQGNVHSPGAFDSCYSIPGASYAEITVNLPALLKDGVPLPAIVAGFAQAGVSPIVGVCMPDECARNLTAFILSPEAESILHVSNITDQIVKDAFLAKVVPETESFSAGGIFTLVLVGILIVLSVMGSVLDQGGVDGCCSIRTKLKKDDDDDGKEDEQIPKWMQIVRCFSFTENLSTLTVMEQRFPVTASLEGMRVLSMQWVILGHTLLIFAMGKVDNTTYLLDTVARRFSMQPLINATVSVDSFFTISGFLLSYVSLRKLRKIAKRNLSFGSYVGTIFMFILHRWLRVVPVLAVVMLANAQLLPSIGNGPLWQGSDLGKYCREYWWTNLIFVNNYYPSQLMKECIGQSWYLGVDMQLFVVSIVLLFIFQGVPSLRKSLIARVSILSAITVASVALRMVVTYNKHVVPQGALLPDQSSVDVLDDSADYKNYVYVQSQYRIGTYLIGVIAGMILDEIEQRRSCRAIKSDKNSKPASSSLSDSLLESGAVGESKYEVDADTDEQDNDASDLIRATSSTGVGSMEYVPLDKSEMRKCLLQKKLSKAGDASIEALAPRKRDASRREVRCFLFERSELPFLFGAAISLGIMCAVLYGLYPTYHGHPTNMIDNVMYVGLNRVAWSLAIAFFILAFATGHLRFGNRLLSLPVFLPLSKLSYSCYLVHIFVLEVVTGVHRVLYHYTDYTLVSLYALTLFLTYATAAFLFVMVELPAARLEALFLPKL